MIKQSIHSNELSQRHYRQIVCRPRALRQQLTSIWGMSWRAGDRQNSFLGRHIRPLGSALMMVQVSYSRANSHEGIALFGVAAKVVPQTATITYDELRLFHDFSRVPAIGARGIVLDPGEERAGSRGNASWVRLGLEVDVLRRRAISWRYRLPVIPQLPEILLGFGRKETARFEITQELCRRGARRLVTNWNGDALRDLGQLDSEIREAQERVFIGLPQAQQEELLRAAWEEAFIPPTDPTNSTGLWLLPHSLTTDVYRATRLFEDFSQLMGANVFNPARLLTEKSIPNPAVELAQGIGFDLRGDLATLARTSEGLPEYLEIEQRLLDLVPVLRAQTAASLAISDLELLTAICQPDLPLVTEPALDRLTEEEQIRLMRSNLKPHISECCTDADLLAAVQCPNGPLWAAGLCQVQTLYRPPAIPLPEALLFSSELLGRSRVQATCWFDSYSAPQAPLPTAEPELALAV